MGNKGGKLVGASHKEGGIDIITPNGSIEAEGGEIIINKAASEQNCELLSQINQSAGNGVKIPCDNTMKQPGKAKNGAQISSATLSEYEKAVSDLHKAESAQKMMKDANSIIRSKKNVEERLAKELNLSEKLIYSLLHPNYGSKLGFRTYQLTNNNANIKRLQARVKMLEGKKAAAKNAAAGKEQKYTFEGGSIEVNYPADRVQIFFDDIPNSDMRTTLKKNGYKWSPSNKAWQRKITPQAIYNATSLMKATVINNSELAKGIEVEDEHRETLEKLSKGKISVDEAVVETAKDHLKEDPNYYSKLEVIEPNTSEEFDQAIFDSIKDHIPADWIGNEIRERVVKSEIHKQFLTGSPEKKAEETERLFEKLKTLHSKKATELPDGEAIGLRFPELEPRHPLNILNSNSPQYKEALKEYQDKKSISLFKGIDHQYKNQYELNKAIEALLTDKGPDHANYTADEKMFIRKYSGYGGLDKYGATGKGGLFEYYTPKDVIEKMWALAYKFGYNNGSVLEPSVATGEFLQFAKPETRTVGFEISPYSAQICKILYPNAEIKLMPFEQRFIKNNFTIKDKTDSLEKFDLVIGNPPYGDFSIVASRYMSGMGEKDHTQARNYVEYFLRRGIDLLKPKGLLIFIIGAQLKNGGTLFLDSGKTPVKEYLAKHCELLDAYRLPDSVFERTGVTSDIIVLQKN